MSKSNSSSNAEVGAEGESLAAAFIAEVRGQGLVFQHSLGDSPHGLDLVSTDESGIMVSEVKAKGPDSISGLSYTSKTVNGRQMDASWVSNGLNKIGIDADSQDVGESIHTELIQVDFGQNTLATFNLDSNGIRTDSSPNEIYSLGEIQNIIDDKNDPRGENRGKL